MTNGKTSSRGFTLIELLVVIAIIGLLASIVFASLSSARPKARDAKRLEDLHSIQTAVELYFNVNNTGPATGPGWWAEINNTCWSTVHTSLQPTYISTVPEDPSSPGVPPPCSTADGYWYYFGEGYKWNNTSIIWTGSATDYVVCSKLEVSEGPNYHVLANPWNGSWILNDCVGN